MFRRYGLSDYEYGRAMKQLKPLDYLTVSQAAARLCISRSRVYALIRSGRLPATKWGRDWQIKESDLKLVKVRTIGYPKGKPRKEHPSD